MEVTESVVDVVTHDPPSVRSLNMKHKVYFSADVRKEILHKTQYVLQSSLYRFTRASLWELENAVET